MANRVELIFKCLFGCVVSVLLAMLIVYKLNFGLLAFIVVVAGLPGFCWMMGIRDRNTLLTIGLFAAIGWVFGSSFTPVVSMTREQQVKEIINSPMAGRGWILPCAAMGALGAFIRVLFVTPPNTQVQLGSELVTEENRII